MDSRERFLSTMHFHKNCRTMLWEFGYWKDTIERWFDEGLPKEGGIGDEGMLPDKKTSLFSDNSICAEGLCWNGAGTTKLDTDVHDYFSLDEGIITIPINTWFSPGYDMKVLSQDENNIIIVDANGIQKKVRRDGNSMPHFIAWPVTGRKDWEKIKEERFFPNKSNRFPANWLATVKEYRDKGYILSSGYSTSFFSCLRDLFGEVNLFLTYYDDPELIKDILNFLCDFWIDLWSQVYDNITPDFALLGEDLAYKNGPLISPAIFKEFMLPCYKKLTSFLKSSGIDIIIVDTDGNFEKLIPLFLEGGVTGFYPFEVQAGMDVVKIRKQYPDMQILGGLDKTKIAQGREAIDRELDEKLPFMLHLGGYIPYADHLIPPDVSWDNFSYYREKLAQYINKT